MIDGSTNCYLDKMQAAFPDKKDLVKIVSTKGSNKLIQTLFNTVGDSPDTYIDKIQAAFTDNKAFSIFS